MCLMRETTKPNEIHTYIHTYIRTYVRTAQMMINYSVYCTVVEQGTVMRAECCVGVILEWSGLNWV